MKNLNQYPFTDIKPLQTGSFSTVYRAWSYSLNKYVALKVVPKDKTSQNILYNEVEIMRTLGDTHPNICQMLDFFEDELNYIIVLEYCECGDLYDFLDIAKRQGDSTAPSLIQLNFQTLTKQLFSALYYTHSLGIAHRDIKPENILLTKNGDIKLADWGHATFEETSTEFHIGTDNYRAPETFYDRNGYNTKVSDYWSLGVTILSLIFGQSPFKSAALNLNNTPEKYSRETNSCSNFHYYLKNPYQFINDYYLAPILAVRDKQPCNYRNGRAATFVWEDMVNIHYVMSFCYIIVDTLITIDVKKRNFFKCIDVCDVFWSIYQGQHSKGKFVQLHIYKESLSTPTSLRELQKCLSVDKNTSSLNSHASTHSLTIATLDENNKRFYNNTVTHNPGDGIPNGVTPIRHSNNFPYKDVANVAYNITSHTSLYNQVA
ncbi:protein kinase FMP48 PWA37_004068 [Arxiozyma heterogenica]|uniref:protein kinase FMP48 n=1 Tax=Arxiozyma heterogenica TaxID=278026 RepID=UPI002F156E45